ncbi:putative ribonuclease H-like domain-containing protein [Tanacetum coccineum]
MYEMVVYDYPEGFTGPSISITNAEPVTPAGERVSTARAIPEEVSTAEPDMDVTLSKVLMDLLKSGKKKSPNLKARDDMDKHSEKKAGGSRKKTLAKKRAGEKQSEETSKRQKMEDDAKKEELRAHLDIIPGDDVAVSVKSLATKYLIVDWKTHVLSEDKMYYEIIEANGSTKSYKIFTKMLDDFDRQDVLLWGDLITVFEPSKDDKVWKAQQDYTLISWRLFDSCGIHVLLRDIGITIHMLIEKTYPLTQEMLSRVLSGKLEVDNERVQDPFTRTISKDIAIREIVDNCKKGLGYNAVPPPYIGNFMPPTIEEWVSDSEEENVSQTKIEKKTTKPSFVKIDFVKAKTKPKQKTDRKTAKQVEGVIDSGCSRNMTGNMSCFIDYEEVDGGYVAFGGNPKGEKIIRKGTIKTGNLDFENVYFMRELKFNLFSVSQVCDKKNSVLFNDTECIVLSPNFKLIDESQVLLRVPRKNNKYSVDLKNIVFKRGLTCLFVKATSDESKLWHRRLGHLNFKTMNKLVKGNLVRGLPSKLFKNDQTCVACQKGKQHKASCKSKTENSISLPLHLLHMDLFGPTFVKSLMKKMYCLVVTDDFSRFTWVFFLATKDETSGILKSFITGIENLVDHKVKVIRCDNGTEFKNREMNQFCEMKEAVNTTCYVQNRVLVVKPHNKTPYELFHGRTPTLSFMRPFRCHVTILNTIDHLGKFDGRADEGFFVGYSLNSKAFKVFNSRTMIVEENLHIRFSENSPNVAGSGSDWLFDIDALTRIMNYEPIVAGTQSNGFTADPPFSQDPKSSQDDGCKPSSIDGKKVDEDPRKYSEGIDQEKEDNANSTNNVNAASINKVNDDGTKTSIELPLDPNMPESSFEILLIILNTVRQSDLVSKRIERSGELKNKKRVEYIKNRQSVWNGIGVNAGDSKLMLLGINLILLVKVNAARHKLTTAGES